MDLTLGVKSGTVGRKLGGGWDLGSTFGIWGLGRMERGAKVNTLLTCLSSHTCHFSSNLSSSLFVHSPKSKYSHLKGHKFDKLPLLPVSQKEILQCFFQSKKATRPKLLLFQLSAHSHIEKEVSSA